MKDWRYSEPYGSETRRKHLERELSVYAGETPENIDRLARNNNLPYAMVLECRLSARRHGNQQERMSRL